jgi:hypothetical protein
MHEPQANKVLAIAVPRINKITSIIWDSPAEEYPESVYLFLWLYVKQAAKEWIEENAPDAWYRPMFD